KIVGEKLVMLRPGAVTADALRCVCDEVEIASAVTASLGENERPLSPGMKYRHYAPSSPLVLLDGTREAVASFLSAAQASENCAILCYSEEKALLKNENIIDIGSESDLKSQAQRLFGALRKADTFGCDIIYAHLPVQEGLGLALYNRLIRAAAHTVRKIDD
ncbi:MAG: translation factor SUA5, partial [Clostridia bacterium]|nr:translation factor SUA5 [Clostridia bacterium]